MDVFFHLDIHAKYAKSAILIAMFNQKGGQLCKNPIPGDIYTRGAEVGRGTLAVYEALTTGGNNTDFVVKIIPFIKRAAVTEFKIAKYAGDIGIGPRVIWETVCDEIGYIVMERIHGYSLANAPLSKPIHEHIEGVKQLLDRMYDAKLYMHDRNLGNFMYGSTISHPEPRYWIIDYDFVDENYIGPRHYEIRESDWFPKNVFVSDEAAKTAGKRTTALNHTFNALKLI